MGEVLGWKRRGHARSRDEMFQAIDATEAERAAFLACGATFHTRMGASVAVYGCVLPPQHEGEHHGDKRGRWRWSDGQDTIDHV